MRFALTAVVAAAALAAVVSPAAASVAAPSSSGARVATGAVATRTASIPALASVAAAGSPAVASAQATAYNQTYLQFNMCGNVCNNGGTAVADDVIRSVNGRNPFIVTLNEVCSAQFNRIDGRLAQYRGRFDATGPTCRGGAGKYGNAILVRGSFTALGSWWLPNPDGGERRRLMCVRPALSGAPRFTACVTHIDNDGARNKTQQINEVARLVHPYWRVGAVLLGGDFNVRPGDSRLNKIYGSCYGGSGHFLELDSGPRCSRAESSTVNEPTHSHGKLDYLFVTSHFSNRNADATSAPRSDHDPLWGTARIGS
jgi:endonuclease/exonuclease/phosphatase family metal-dependent hydrolase